MDPLTAFRGNALGNLTPSRDQRVEAFKNLTAGYRTQVQAANGRGAAFQAMLKSIQKAAGPQSARADSVVDDNAGDSGTPERKVGNELGKDAYLQLLVTQMSNQDPMSPMDNTAMVAQLAQFSALEQMQNLNTQFESMSGNIDQLNFITAQGMLNRYVEGVDAEGKAVKGVVKAVGLDGSIVVLDVDGKPLPMSGVLAIGARQPEPDEAAKAAKAALKAAEKAARKAAEGEGS